VPLTTRDVKEDQLIMLSNTLLTTESLPVETINTKENKVNAKRKEPFSSLALLFRFNLTTNPNSTWLLALPQWLSILMPVPRDSNSTHLESSKLPTVPIKPTTLFWQLDMELISNQKINITF